MVRVLLRHFLRARATWGLLWHERPAVLLGGISLLIRAMVSNMPRGQRHHLATMGARAIGIAVKPSGSSKSSPRGPRTASKRA